MLILTLEQLQINLSQAISTDYYVAWIDLDQLTIPAGQPTTNAFQGNAATSGLTTILPVPINGHQSIVQFVTIFNNHASTTQVVNVQIYDGSSTFNVQTASLLPGYKLSYQNDVGWQLFNASGLLIESFGSITLTGDVTGSGTKTIATTYTGVVPINKGGTGQTTANTAFNALAPSQTGNAGKVLTTDGTNTSWEETTESDTVIQVFNYGDASPEFILQIPANKFVFSVQIIITTTFNGTGAALTVGDSGNPASLMSATQNDPSFSTNYLTNPSAMYGSPTNINIYITPGSGASQGAGYVVLTIQH